MPVYPFVLLRVDNLRPRHHIASGGTRGASRRAQHAGRLKVDSVVEVRVRGMNLVQTVHTTVVVEALNLNEEGRDELLVVGAGDLAGGIGAREVGGRIRGVHRK